MSERKKTLPHDASYKDFFSHPAQVQTRGELQNQKETLLEILESKFAGAVPQATVDYLGRETDLKRLRSLTVAASCADSAADFAVLVDKERSEAR